MELKVSSPKLGGGSLPDCISDPEEKEVSDEDDDDRNHKHRGQDRHPQSLGRDSMDPLFTRPYRKYKKLFEIGHPVRENESLGGEAWKNSNGLPPENDLTSKFDRKHTGFASLPRGNLDLNQRIRSNQTFNKILVLVGEEEGITLLGINMILGSTLLILLLKWFSQVLLLQVSLQEGDYKMFQLHKAHHGAPLGLCWEYLMVA
ncbi:hypothetical protein J1N35_020455 [Gossypium stocksii]|uniref:Uncharacterized protein n=1 Tax=Gossypium stocksii TaxID=47602 RepID=A0A9D4A1G7_9ROSI|nr:hypothetical protein J1N35_020455 [Gossypium stocksii]